MFKLTKLVTLAIFIVLYALLSSYEATASKDVIKWRCQSFVGANDESSGLVIRNAINNIKKKTNGKLDIEIFGAGALMPNTQIYDAVKQGIVQMGVTSNVYTLSEFPLANLAYGTPMNFQKPWEIIYFYKQLGFEDALKKGYDERGFRYFTGNIMPNQFALKQPIRRLSDFKGKKLRATGLFQDVMTELGGAATYITGGEIYTALATGVIDGAMWGGIPGANSIKLFEICKSALDTNFGYGSWGFFINKSSYDKLPDEYKRAVDESFGEVLFTGATNYARLGAELTVSLSKKGIEVTSLPREDELALYEIASKIWDNKIAPKSPDCKEWVGVMKTFMNKLGYLK